MRVNLDDVQAILFALNLAVVEGHTRDPEGLQTRRLWEAVLPVSMPEPEDPPLTEAWAVLVTMARAYAKLADQPLGPRPTTSRADENAIWQ